MQLREIAVKSKLPKSLVDFIVREGSLQVSKKARDQILEKENKQGTCDKIFATLPTPNPNENKYYRYKITRIFFSIAMSNLFGTFIMIFIVLNTLVLSLDRYPNMPT